MSKLAHTPGSDDDDPHITRGRATVTKEIGPIDVKIRCTPQIVHRIDMVDKGGGENETVAEVTEKEGSE